MFYINLYFTILSAAAGAVMGSFLNCFALRYASGEKVPRGRSRCPKCGHTLSARELIPLLSYIIQRGRCRACGEKISPRYPVTELCGAAMFAAVYLRYGMSLYTVELMVLCAALYLLSLIDLDTMELPGAPMLAALAGWVVFLPAHDDIIGRAAGGVITALVVFGAILGLALLMDRVLKRESLGGGDLKLLAVLALYLGPVGVAPMLLLSCAAALVFAAATHSGGKPFPFGPSLALGAYVTLLIDPEVILNAVTGAIIK